MNSTGHVVKEGKIGNTAYEICDDFYRDRTKTDIAQTLRSLNQVWKRTNPDKISDGNTAAV